MKFKVSLSRLVEQTAIIEVEAKDAKDLVDKLTLEEVDAEESLWEYCCVHEYPIVTHVNGGDAERFYHEVRSK